MILIMIPLRFYEQYLYIKRKTAGRTDIEMNLCKLSRRFFPAGFLSQLLMKLPRARYLYLHSCRLSQQQLVQNSHSLQTHLYQQRRIRSQLVQQSAQTKGWRFSKLNLDRSNRLLLIKDELHVIIFVYNAGSFDCSKCVRGTFACFKSCRCSCVSICH